MGSIPLGAEKTHFEWFFHAVTSLDRGQLNSDEIFKKMRASV